MQSIPSPFCGLFNLNKPGEMTSRRVVDMVQRLVRPAKAGHAGTLDPLATGVLVICVGGATHFIEYVQRLPKRYVGTFLLGRSSPTEDVEGDVAELPDAPVPGVEEIEAAARRFVGQIEQRPPAFSALKINGRPAYKLARQGKPVELKPRPVEIHRIEVRAYRYPELVLEIECGGGTYIRSLGRDLAESLGTAAVMSSLVRTGIGGFTIDEAIDPRGLARDNLAAFLLPPLRAVECLPCVRLSADESARMRNGQIIQCNDPLAVSPALLHRSSGDGGSPKHRELAAIDPDGRLIGVLGLLADGRWRPLRNLPTNPQEIVGARRHV